MAANVQFEPLFGDERVTIGLATFPDAGAMIVDEFKKEAAKRGFTQAQIDRAVEAAAEAQERQRGTLDWDAATRDIVRSAFEALGTCMR